VEGHNKNFFGASRPTCAPTIRSVASANGVYRSTVKQRCRLLLFSGVNPAGDRGNTSPPKIVSLWSVTMIWFT